MFAIYPAVLAQSDGLTSVRNHATVWSDDPGIANKLASLMTDELSTWHRAYIVEKPWKALTEIYPGVFVRADEPIAGRIRNSCERLFGPAEAASHAYST